MLDLKTVSIEPDGYYGALVWDGRAFAVSVDAGVLTNGTYRCTRDFYHAGNYPTFEIHMEGHTRVLFHKGNFGRESKACVIVAESFATIGSEHGVADSKHGFEEFMSLTDGLQEFDLTVSGR